MKFLWLFSLIPGTLGVAWVALKFAEGVAWFLRWSDPMRGRKEPQVPPAVIAPGAVIPCKTEEEIRHATWGLGLINRERDQCLTRLLDLYGAPALMKNSMLCYRGLEAHADHAVFEIPEFDYYEARRHGIATLMGLQLRPATNHGVKS